MISTVSFKSMSDYRSALMGLAMLMVVFFHLPFHISNPFFCYLHLNGQIGVDIFVLVSGMGLYYSLRKNHSLQNYYIKRLVRIFPIYVLLVTIICIIRGEDNFVTYIYKVTTVGYWVGGRSLSYDWFIPSILLLYLVFPAFYWILQQKNGTKYGCLLVMIFYVIPLFLPEKSPFEFLFRVPSFFMGAIIGRLILDLGGAISKFNWLFIGFALIIGLGLSFRAFGFYDLENLSGLVLIDNGWAYIPYVFIVIGFSLFCCMIIRRIPNGLVKYLSIVGGMSIEVYLIHFQFIDLTRFITDDYNLNKPLIGLCLILLCFIVAYFVHEVNERMMKKLLSIFIIT